MAQKKDEGLNGNEKIEQAVCQLQQEPTQEQLAHTLTVIRRRMRENGQVVVAADAAAGPPHGRWGQLVVCLYQL